MATRMDRYKKTAAQNHQNNDNKPKRKKHYFRNTLLIIILILCAIGGKIYYDAHHAVSQMQVGNEKGVSEKVKEGQPISILILGVDDGALDRGKSGGRSDTMMVLTLNPQKKQATLVSLERDSYVTIAGEGTKAKLNSAYAYGGAKTAVKTVENLLDIPIDYYTTINMGGLESLTDAVGGITVKSNLAFTYDGYTFKKGENDLKTGKEALAFVRMRYDDPEGDYGRQRRQRAVVEALMAKMKSPSALLHYKSILNEVSDNAKTDMNFKTMQDVVKKYHSCFNNVKSDYLHGEGFMLNGISYQDVSTDLPRIQKLLQSQLNVAN